MKPSKLLAVALVAPLLGSGCLVTTTRSTTWTDQGPAQQDWARYGRVEQVREVVQETRGDPGGGAVAGAIIGGLVGSAIGGRHNGASTVAGAIGGAMIGANASQGGEVHRRYEVTVRFDDGGVQTFVYANGSPFRPGDWVTQTPQGLYPR
jgi:outer membrane lipoprotein SlyB